jgi:uncharacterized protein (TIGR02246 family)
MPRPKPETASLMAAPDDIEAQFYEALQQADIDKLMAVWADDEEIVCVHPGGPRIVGAAAIRASFEAIFANGPVAVHPEHVHRLVTMGCAVHHLGERAMVPTADGLRTAWVLATNVYVKTAQGWRLAAHHASPGSLGEEPPTVGDFPSTLH